MTITVNRKEFIDALTVGSAMEGKAKTTPILGFTKITTSQLAMTITSFDLECSITKLCNVVSCDALGEFCVCANDLIKAIKALKNDEITLVVENNLLTISHSSGTMSMPVQNATTFPTISQDSVEDVNCIVLQSEWLKEWIMVSRNFVADDDFRPIMNGMYIHADACAIEVCATDAHKLYTDKIEGNYTFDDVEAVLPSRAFAPLLTILNGVDEVTMSVDTKNFIFTTSDTSIFDPVLCELMYRWFLPDGGSILDPFAGGSVRGIVANYLGYKYTGIDIRKEQVDSNIEQGRLILGENTPNWIIGDSNKILDTIDQEYDMVFSCPPYADLEVYSDLEGDISNMTYDDFLVAYESIIRKSCNKLKSGGYAIFVVGEVRDKKGYYYGFVPDTYQCFKNAGLRLYNEAILSISLASAALRAVNNMKNKKLVKVHQNILIFIKP